MTRLFLVAGVAALAIASAAPAKPGGGNSGGNPHGSGGPPAERGGGGHGDGGERAAKHGGEGRGNKGFEAPQRAERKQAKVMERQQSQGFDRKFERKQAKAMERQQSQGFDRKFERRQAKAMERQQSQGLDRKFERRQAKAMERQQSQGFDRKFERRQAKAMERQQSQGFDRKFERKQAKAMERQLQRDSGFERVQQQYAANYPNYERRIASFRDAPVNYSGRMGLIEGCPPGLWMKNNGCLPPGQAARLLGQPLSVASALIPLSVLPQPFNAFYPETDDYYWRYGDGYLYQVDRTTQLIASLLPLIGGGYVPGQYLPQPYMASYVPDYYGLDSFYPDYGDTCNRYAEGVIYEVDCATGYVEQVIPSYVGGYGVGQILPSAYNYYNVPMQYRSVYYDTPDYGYWYAPGAIYQYDRGTSLITSVAALMSPGFSIGQPLPVGYDAYNVPYDYRDTYYDSPNAWYRYNNGNIYQVDPVTQIVTAIVASLLT